MFKDGALLIRTTNTSGKVCSIAVKLDGEREWRFIPNYLAPLKGELERLWEMTEMVDAFILEQCAMENAYPKVAGLYVDIAVPEAFQVPTFPLSVFEVPRYTACYHPYRGVRKNGFTWWIVDAHGSIAHRCVMPGPPSVGVVAIAEPGRTLTYDVTAVKCADYDEILRSRAVHEAERKKAEEEKFQRVIEAVVDMFINGVTAGKATGFAPGKARKSLTLKGGKVSSMVLDRILMRMPSERQRGRITMQLEFDGPLTKEFFQLFEEKMPFDSLAELTLTEP